MPRWRPKWLVDAMGQKINRAPSPILAAMVPWLSVVLGSIIPGLLFVTSAPVVPPFGLLVLLAWKQLRPGLLPVWAGLPLGLIDDLYSGQPFGSAVLLWSLAAILLDLVEARIPWRHYAMEWILGVGIIAAYIAAALVIANAAGGSTRWLVIMPQIALSALAYPVVGRLVARLDQLRLLPIAEAR
jgi:rod shape-determining protein MreD